MRTSRTFFLFLLLASALKCQSQLNEKYLKLNAIKVIDSVKTYPGSNTIFTIKVPDSVYWRIDQFYFQNTDFLVSNNNFRLYVNNVYIPQINWELPTSSYYGFFRNSPLWVAPRSVIRAVLASNVQGGFNFTLYLAAHEFYLDGQ